MTPEQLKTRTKRFALQVIALTEQLPTYSKAADVIGKQLIRSATSVGANYRACCRAKSQADFASKAATTEEEADESAYWLELLEEACLLPVEPVTPLLNEANELTKIMRASRETAGGNVSRRRGLI